MKKRMVAVLCAGLMVFAACGDSGSGGDSGSLDSCDDLVIAGVDMVQDMLDELSNLSLEDVAALGDEEPEAFQELTTRGEELQLRAEELDCSDEELQQGLLDNIDSLSADGPFAELVLEGLRSDPTVFGN